MFDRGIARMAKTSESSQLRAARALLDQSLSYATLVARLPNANERVKAQQQRDELESRAGADAVAVWERLACTLLTLAPDLPRFVAKRSVTFSIPDGKYKQQVFALQIGDHDVLHIYCPDVLAQAKAAGLVIKGPEDRLILAHSGGAANPLDEVVADLPGAPQQVQDFVRPMLGWGKKALHVAMSVTADPATARAVLELCALAALKWNKGD
jgi:hypothetical protein